ncbi:MAG: serine protease [Deltaproteobacteria bacterium]|nr:serine protease [Deltaproteobacteria bacterium]
MHRVAARGPPRHGPPFFLTANHCVDRQIEAESAQIVWSFETDVCNGEVPLVEELPRSLGADFLTGGDPSDYTLMLLHGVPPEGTAYLPWNIEDVPDEEPIVVIHHPGGAFKRISFGQVVGEHTNLWTVLYNEGSTEGGSSGAPLFRFRAPRHRPAQRRAGRLLRDERNRRLRQIRRQLGAGRGALPHAELAAHHVDHHHDPFARHG